MSNSRPYVPKKVYTEEEIDLFCEYAVERGITGAIRHLTYPSYPTAMKWIDERNITVPKSITKTLARLNQDTYSMEERLSVINDIVDKHKEALLNEHDPQNLKRITESYKIAMETYNLILGKATNITQKTDAFDNSYIDLLEDMRAKNESMNPAKD